MRTAALLVALATAASLAQADITGAWTTIDDKTNEPKSIIEIYERDGKYWGRIRDLLSTDADAVCDECKGELKGKPLLGMEIITAMEKQGEEYSGGEILDPASGKVYRAKLWQEGDDVLKVRGYLGMFYRTQTWQRAE